MVEPLTEDRIQNHWGFSRLPQGRYPLQSTLKSISALDHPQRINRRYGLHQDTTPTETPSIPKPLGLFCLLNSQQAHTGLASLKAQPSHPAAQSPVMISPDGQTVTPVSRDERGSVVEPSVENSWLSKEFSVPCLSFLNSTTGTIDKGALFQRLM